MRRQLVELVAREIEPLTEAQIQLALGVSYTFARDSNGRWVHLTDPLEIERALNSGDPTRVYQSYAKAPSVRAFAFLLDQAIGKAPHTLALETGLDRSIEIRWERE
jgi:hypothetical protein